MFMAAPARSLERRENLALSLSLTDLGKWQVQRGVERDPLFSPVFVRARYDGAEPNGHFTGFLGFLVAVAALNRMLNSRNTGTFRASPMRSGPGGSAGPVRQLCAVSTAAGVLIDTQHGRSAPLLPVCRSFLFNFYLFISRFYSISFLFFFFLYGSWFYGCSQYHARIKKCGNLFPSTLREIYSFFLWK